MTEKSIDLVIHRVIFGSIERFIGILVEHLAGKFPTWLSPVQVKILTISELYNNYAEAVKNKLEKSNIRVSLDCRAEKTGYKVRDARIEGLPYIIVIGEKEQNSENISLRSRKNGDEDNCSIDAFISRITQEIDAKMLDN